MIFKRIIILIFLVIALFFGFSQTKGDEVAFLKSIKLYFLPQDYYILEKIGLSEKRINKITLYDYEPIAEKIVTYLENNGYPFAKVSLSTFFNNDSTLSYNVNIEKNKFVLIDSVVLKGNAKLRPSFLWPYLGLRKKTAYSEKKIQQIGKKISSLAFVTEIQQSGISFTEDKALLYLYLDKRKTNRFDGYIGLQPESSSNGKFSLIGNVSLTLQNVFRVGESISLSWHSSEKYSQFLSINTQFPYLFYTKFGISAAFELDKRDTSFLNLNFTTGISYRLNYDCAITPFFSYYKSQILGKNKVLTNSSFVACNKIMYGLSGIYSNLDYIFNPRKGVEVYVEASAGTKKIDYDEFLSEAIYDKERKQTSYSLQGKIVGYIPFFKNLTLVLRTRAGSFLGGTLYNNELYKIGGVDFIRGFNSNELLASTFLIYSSELRYLFANNSNVHFFFDGAVYERNCHNDYLFDSPLGFGLGVDVGVKSGIFYFEYALPRQRGNKISLKTGKIHFGIKAMF